MRILILLLFLTLVASASAQKIVDSLVVYDFPVRKGVVYSYDQGSFIRICDMGGTIVTISTIEDSLFHFESGRVAAVYNFGDAFALTIKSTKGEYFTYSNLKSVTLRKEDIVTRGMLIGFVSNSYFGDNNEVSLQLHKNGKNVSFTELLNVIKNNISSKSEECLNLKTNSL